MKKAKKATLSQLAKAAAKIKINPNLDDTHSDAAFIREKMRKGKEMLAKAGLPK